MQNGFIVTILLGLGAAALCSDIELQAADYIDKTLINNFHGANKIRFFLRDFIQMYGSDNPEETTKVLKLLQASLREFVENWDDDEPIPKFKDKFNVKNDLEVRSVKVSDLYNQLYIINRMIANPKANYSRFNLEFGFLSLIKKFHADSLESFAKGKEIGKLQVFLLEHTKIILSHYLDKAIEVVSSYQPNWMDNIYIRSVIARGPKSRDGKMLGSVCRLYSGEIGLELETYTWARLLLPEKVTGKVPKLVKLWRVCATVDYQRSYSNKVKN